MSDTTKVKEAELHDILSGLAWNGKYTDAGQYVLSEVEMKRATNRILTLIDKYTRESRLDEVDGLRREFWRTTWEPYEPDSIFADRIAQLTEQKDTKGVNGDE